LLDVAGGSQKIAREEIRRFAEKEAGVIETVNNSGEIVDIEEQMAYARRRSDKKGLGIFPPLLSFVKRVRGGMQSALDVLKPGVLDEAVGEYVMDTPNRVRNKIHATLPDPNLLTPEGMRTPEGQMASRWLADTLMGFGGATVWHGSPHKFDKFDLSAPKTTGGAFNRHGVSVSPEMTVAQRYADDFGRGKGQVYKVEDSTTKPLSLSARDFHNLQRLTGEVDHYAGKLPESQTIGLEIFMRKHGIVWRDGDHPIEAVRRAGYDSIVGAGNPSKSGLSTAESLIFDPAQLKILGRNARPIDE